jgi:hypothetical protein
MGRSVGDFPFANELFEAVIGARISDPDLISAALAQESLGVEITDQAAT